VKLGDALEDVLSTVWPKRAKLRSFALRNNLGISFDIFVYLSKRSIPILTIDADILRQVAWFGADIGIDMAIL
jgi:hypothetical protein